MILIFKDSTCIVYILIFISYLKVFEKISTSFNVVYGQLLRNEDSKHYLYGI